MNTEITKEMHEELSIYGLTESDLTPEELDMLMKEINAKKEGHIILDGVLSNPDWLYRKNNRR